ncbi:MAG TPA: serine/threonine-protein kinase [Dokdonella sp.]|uniref:serine/threonine-protein kinase n=1 Tax=Dokdonella sp. TaxID=2291710 RepID=UPI002D80ACE4|nr:serine/threonine-protein kinase [Dokdonella sp.]HET9031597.1 serine/threonine-protein kinase [Dokdonella sp.]
MDSERLEAWRAADRLFGEWLDQPQAQRAEWLKQQTMSSATWAALERLIAEQASTSGLPSALEHVEVVERPAAPLNNLAGRRIGDWKLIEEIGRGGMSVVYKARRCDVNFEQVAAVKLLGLAALGAQGVGRFEQERQVLARLRHPHIATLIDGGVNEDGSPFLVMPLIVGRELDHYCDEQNLPWRDRVHLIEQICDAVAHAHQNLLVHRDLKPANILVSDEGVPVLLDFGIAKLLDTDDAVTRTGLRAMTPHYAAPEQIDGAAITTATDVYALGVILRGLCADCAALPSDLVNIIGMATRVEPERRYPDARAMGEDLHRLLAGYAVRATPDSAGYRLRSFLRRRRGWVAAASAVLVVLIAGLIATQWQAHQAALQAREAMRQSERAEATRAFLFSLFEAGNREQTGGDDLRVSALVELGAARLPEFAERPELHAEMAALLGHIDTTLGKYAQAHALLDAASQSAERSGEARLLAQVRLDRATLANAEGDSTKAVKLFDEALELHSNDPEFRVSVLTGWTYAMQNSGRTDEAFSRLAAELDSKDSSYTSTQRGELLLSQASLAADPEKKLAIVIEAQTQLSRQAMAPATDFQLEEMLGSSFERVGKSEQAFVHQSRAAALADRLYPGWTRMRARAHNNFGSILRSVNRLTEANVAYQLAEQIYRHLGDEHSAAFAALLNNRGVLLRDLGDSARALPLIEQAYAIASEQFGPADRRTGLALQNTATARADASADPHADKEWLQAREIARPSTNARSTYKFLLVGTQIALDLGRTDEAQLRFDEAESLVESESLELPNSWSLRRQTLLGTLESLQGHAQNAIAAFDHAREFAQADEKARHSQLWRIEYAIAEHEERNGNPVQAREHYSKALDALIELGATSDASSVLALRKHLKSLPD